MVELAAVSDPELVPQAVASALAVREQPGRPLLETLTASLKPKQILILLDNCEHLIDACAVLAESLLLACPHLRILATSREPLGIAGEVVWRVPSLSLSRLGNREQGTGNRGDGAGTQSSVLPIRPASGRSGPPQEGGISQSAFESSSEAVHLFLERACAVQSAFALTEHTLAAVEQICRKLDGLPLAIELAAARLGVLTVEQIEERIEDRFRLLTDGYRTAPSRQQTLRATIDWSYNLLSDPERTLFDRLSVFAGSFTLSAAEAIGNGEQVLDLLADLVAKSLVQVEFADARAPNPDTLAHPSLILSLSKGPVEGHPTPDTRPEARYRLLETLRQYGAEQLEASGEAVAIRRRHAGYYLALAEEAEPRLRHGSRRRWLDRLEMELDNLRAALAWCKSDDASVETGLRLAAALDLFWHFNDHWREGRDHLEALLARADERLSRSVRARALCVSGRLAVFLREDAAARQRLDESIALGRELGDRQTVGAALTWHARRSVNRGELAEGRVHATEAVALLRGAGDPYGLALALHYLAELLQRLRADRDARPAAEESVAIFKRIEDHWGIALASQVLYNSMMVQGDFAGARAVAAKSLAMRRTAGVKYATATSLLQLADAARLQGDTHEATARYEESLALSREIGVKQDVASALRRLSYLSHEQGGTARAIPLLHESLSLSFDIGNMRGVALALLALAHIAATTGQPERAARLAGAASIRIGGAGLMSLEPLVQIEHERSLACIRAGLDEQRFSALWSEGVAMPLEEAIADALRADSWLRQAADGQRIEPRPPTAHRPGGLTPREVEVLALLAAGSNNKEIAAALVVSLRTVERHIGSIYGKAGIRGRADAARYALGHGLISTGDRA